MLRFTGFLLLLTSSWAFELPFHGLSSLTEPTFVTNNPNDPYDILNQHCMKAYLKHDILSEFYNTFKHPTVNVSQIDTLLGEWLQIRNESQELFVKFEENLNQTSWKNFTYHNAWQLDLVSCVANIIVADEVALTLLGLREGVLKPVNPDLIYGYIKGLAPQDNHVDRDISNMFHDESSAGKLIDAYFSKSSTTVTKNQVIAALDQLATDVAKLRVDFAQMIGAVYAKLLDSGKVLAPDDEGIVRGLARHLSWVAEYVVDYKKKFQANLI